MDETEEVLTPRGEFELTFGHITDEQWQWLKEFCVRNPVTGFKTQCPHGDPHYVEAVRNG